jgi:hypothetical protein
MKTILFLLNVIVGTAKTVLVFFAFAFIVVVTVVVSALFSNTPIPDVSTAQETAAHVEQPLYTLQVGDANSGKKWILDTIKTVASSGE